MKPTAWLALALAFGCSSKAGDTDIESKDILARTETAPSVQVKHVLLGWKELGSASAYAGHLDPRAAKRTQAEAAKLATEIADKLRENPDDIDKLVHASSEDPGSLAGEPYEVNAASKYVPEFKKLALRLKLKEVGIVKTDFGYHVMERVPPDPLESAEILARTAAETKPVNIQHIMIGWKGTRSPDPRAQKRTKADADKLAKDALDKVRAGADMAALMKELSEDPTSKNNAQVYEIGPDTPVPDPFKNLALRLKDGEAGLVKTIAGWHVIKRVPPPPPDPLESADILKREPATAKAKVKHILLGWTEVHADDQRGIKRSRADLDKLVKETVDKLAKGAKFEALMAELSEDGGSAKTGEAYDVSPSAQLVPPFKKLSLRLKVGEVGVVKSDFGMHIIKRVE